MSTIKKVLLYLMAAFYVFGGVNHWVRLPFQLVLIAWAWWYTDAPSE